MAKKKIQIGSLRKTERTYDGVAKTFHSIALGSLNNRDAKYNRNVTVTVTDDSGTVLHTQTNGFLNLTDIRAQPKELLAAKIIDETEFQKMEERVAKVPKEVRFSLEIPASK